MGASSCKAFDVTPYRQKGSTYEAIVAGSTGATGRYIVESLVASPLCTKVTALTRRDIPEDTYDKVFPGIDVEKAKEKLVLKVVDYEEIAADPENALAGTVATRAFSALGSAPFSEKVDYAYSNAFATCMRKKGVTHMALVSASTANSGSIIGYNRLLGKRQDFFASLGFSALHVAMPGMIDRDELAAQRLKERILLPLVPQSMTTKAQTVARALVTACEATEVQGTVHYSIAAMKALESDSYPRTDPTN